MFHRLGAIVSRRWLWVLLFWAVLVAGIRYAAPPWDEVTHDGDFAYLPEEMTSVQGEKLLEAAFPDVLSKSEVVLVLSRNDGPLQEADYRIAVRLLEEFSPGEADGRIVGVLHPWTPVIGQKLVSSPGPDGQALLIILQLRNEFMAVDNWDLMGRIHERLADAESAAGFPEGLELGVTGSAAIGYDMLSSAQQSIRNTEWTTILLVIAILLLVYRAPGLVVVPLATIGVSLAVAMGLVALATEFSDRFGWFDFKVFKTTKIFVVVILFGAGTDYCLFLISRYKEELERGLRPAEAIAEALGRVGDALAASALTTIVGLGTMVLADFGKFRNSGPAIAVCLVVALAASMTLAPALLRAMGRAVFWPFGVRWRVREGIGEAGRAVIDELPGSPTLFGRFWERLSRQIIARPGLILVVSLLLLSPLVYQGLSVEVTYDLLSELRADCRSVEGTRLLRRYFPAGQTGPVTVLAFNRHGGFEEGEGRGDRIRVLTEDLYALEYRDSLGAVTRPITSVRSLVEPLGEPPEKVGFFGSVQKSVVRSHSQTKNTYLAQSPRYAGKVTRFDIVFQYDPFSAESIRLLDHVENHLYAMADDPQSKWHDTDFYFVGTTAGIRDLRAVTTSDQALIQKLVPIAVLAVLVLILRRPLICIYLILSVLFGYFVTIGTTKLLFWSLYGETFHGLDWKVPIFLFVLLIALGQDYNVYLTTRVFEEQRRRGATEGLRVALVRTGGIITSCGVIMAGTFASMTTGTLRAMHELGFALAFGVLLDTFVIRTILVPAFLVIWDRCWSKSPPAEPVRGPAGRQAAGPAPKAVATHSSGAGTGGRDLAQREVQS